MSIVQETSVDTATRVEVVLVDEQRLSIDDVRDRFEELDDLFFVCWMTLHRGEKLASAMEQDWTTAWRLVESEHRSWKRDSDGKLFVERFNYNSPLDIVFAVINDGRVHVGAAAGAVYLSVIKAITIHDRLQESKLKRLEVEQKRIEVEEERLRLAQRQAEAFELLRKELNLPDMTKPDNETFRSQRAANTQAWFKVRGFFSSGARALDRAEVMKKID